MGKRLAWILFLVLASFGVCEIQLACTPVVAEAYAQHTKLPHFTWTIRQGVYYLIVEHKVTAQIKSDNEHAGFYALANEGGIEISRWDDLKAAQHVAELIFVHEGDAAPCISNNEYLIIPAQPENSYPLFPKTSDKPSRKL